MSEFEDNLLDDLMTRHGAQLAAVERPPTHRPGGRGVRTAAGVLAVAGVVAGGITVLGNSSPAYAVTENPDGTVTVSISDIKAIDPANAKLRELGVRAKAVPETSDCASLEGREMYAGSDWSIRDEADGSVTLGPDLPEGYTVLLSVSDAPGRGTGLGFTGPVADPAPSCVLDPAHDPSMQGG